MSFKVLITTPLLEFLHQLVSQFSLVFFLFDNFSGGLFSLPDLETKFFEAGKPLSHLAR